MIIQLRGTSGSGKTTAMKSVIDSLYNWNSYYVPKRKKPLWMVSDEFPHVAVLGHYESPCGGCDTIGSARQVYEVIDLLLPETITTVLCEGLLLSEDVKWTSQLVNHRLGKGGVWCYFLNTPLDRCLANISLRRKSAGNEKEVDPKNTTNRVTTIERARLKLMEAGVNCRWTSPRQAPDVILNRLRSQPCWKF